jgi:prepilin-type N-terminal cleavage/methylation domain-containing protein
MGNTDTQQKRIRGFTLIELTMVMVVVAVLGVVAMSRLANTETSVTVEADHLARDIRHMQMLALTWGQTLRLTFPAANQYRVVCASGSATPPCNGAGAVTDPADSAAFDRPLAPGVTVTGAALDLDGLGRPVAGGVLITTVPARSFTLSGGAESSTVNVERLTGFVDVVY